MFLLRWLVELRTLPSASHEQPLKVKKLFQYSFKVIQPLERDCFFFFVGV